MYLVYCAKREKFSSEILRKLPMKTLRMGSERESEADMRDMKKMVGKSPMNSKH